MRGSRGRLVRRLVLLVALIPAALLASPAAAGADTKPSARTARKVVTRAEPAQTRPALSAVCLHVVKRGESISRIARRYHVARTSIIAVNDMPRPDDVRAGQRLRIPGCRDTARVDDSVPISVAADGSQLLARVGPRRIPTRLHLSVPDFVNGVLAFDWPVDGTVVSGFGRRRAGWHAGVDISAEPGAKIRAAAAGTVIFSGSERYYGRMIRVEHQDGFVTLYAHNLENLVEVGDEVVAGAVIATVGRTGHATGEHLHFEIRRDGVAYNPLHLLGHEAPVLASTPPPPPVEVTAQDDEEDRE